jgi:hypothetical protein
MTNTANEETVRRLLDASAASDGTKMLAVLAPEIEITHTSGGAEEVSTVTRREFIGPAGRLDVRKGEVQHVGDVVARGNLVYGEILYGDEEHALSVPSIYTVEGGRVVRVARFSDSSEAARTFDTLTSASEESMAAIVLEFLEAEARRDHEQMLVDLAPQVHVCWPDGESFERIERLAFLRRREEVRSWAAEREFRDLAVQGSGEDGPIYAERMVGWHDEEDGWNDFLSAEIYWVGDGRICAVALFPFAIDAQIAFFETTGVDVTRRSSLPPDVRENSDRALRPPPAL